MQAFWSSNVRRNGKCNGPKDTKTRSKTNFIGQEIGYSALILNVFYISLFLRLMYKPRDLYFFFFLLVMDLDWNTTVSSLGGLDMSEDGVSTGSLITVMSTV